MFINIDTNDATNILIYVPSSANSSLCSLIELFENNAVFIKDGWSSLTKVKPKASITIGDTFVGRSQNGEVEYTVAKSDAVVEDFEVVSAELFISFKEAKEKIESENKKLQALVSELQQKNDSLKNKIDMLIEYSDESYREI